MPRPQPDARNARGIQAEVLASLAVVMLTATGLLAAFFFQTHSDRSEGLRATLGRALLAEARAPGFALGVTPSDAEWRLIGKDGRVRDRSGSAAALDAKERELADEAVRTAKPLLRIGVPWEPVRFATPITSGGRVAVARLEPAVSGAVLIALILADSAVFTALGLYLLRRRVVVPLRRLAGAAREIAEGRTGARVPVTGVGEVAEVAWSFNEMSEALERRTTALEKAMSELRDTNQRLSRARAGLDRAERLAAVGRLAAGVAHEVGNPMGAMLSFLELARRAGPLPEEADSHLARVSEQGQRVREILRQLLDFSRPPRASRTRVDVGQVAEQAVALVRAQSRYARIRFDVSRDDRTVWAVADESMLAQVLLNLVINAADAVAEEVSPEVRLSVRPAALRARAGEDPSSALGRRSPDAIECEVSDNGPGVPPEDRERIFDPFYTTKAPGEGTGLGLANAQRLAEEQGGVLEYGTRSVLGGAAFSLRLPICDTDTAPGIRFRETA